MESPIEVFYMDSLDIANSPDGSIWGEENTEPGLLRNTDKERKMSFGKPESLLEATARTYRDGHDEEDRFTCPACGIQSNVYSDDFAKVDGKWVAVVTCYHCEAKVRVTYRRMFRKNY